MLNMYTYGHLFVNLVFNLSLRDKQYCINNYYFQTKEEGTQASFDSDDEESKKMKILGQEQLLRLAQGGTISGNSDFL